MANLNFVVDERTSVQYAEVEGRLYAVTPSLFGGFTAMVGSNPAQHISSTQMLYETVELAKKACERHNSAVVGGKKIAPINDSASLDDFYKQVAKASGTTVEVLKAKFGMRNPGMQRMQLNMIMKRLAKVKAAK